MLFGFSQTELWPRSTARMARQADHKERREVFAMAALRVIMRAGDDGLTVREVAKQAGFTTRALTHYFTSNDQVLIEASTVSDNQQSPHMEPPDRPQTT